MKKIFIFILTIILILSATVCVNNADKSNIVPSPKSFELKQDNLLYMHGGFGRQNSANLANDLVNRIYGSTRYETSYAIADELKSVWNIEKFNNIIVANGVNFPDALSGSYLSIIKKAPIVLVNEKYIDYTIDYIKNNLYIDGTVYVLGGIDAVSYRVDEELKEYNVKRLYGDTRYETNLKILEETGIYDSEILVCTGNGYADSISASAVGKPIMLVGNHLTESQRIALSGSCYRFIIIGGTSAVSEIIENELKTFGTVERISGSNRYETSALVAKRFFNDPKSAVVTYSHNFPDGLCGGALANAINAPILLASTCFEKEADIYTKEHNITSGIILGGNSAITDESANIIFTDTDYIGHNYEAVVTDPTCINEGYVTHTCSNCGVSYKGKTIAKIEHDYVVTTIEATTGWGGYDHHECSMCGDSYTDNETKQLSASEWPKGYRDDTCTIIIYKEWHYNAWCYIAHLRFTDYTRFGTACANDTWVSYETTSHAAKRLGAIFAVNGPYTNYDVSAYEVVRSGKVFNDKGVLLAVYNANTGVFASAKSLGIKGKLASEAVAAGEMTDSLNFWSNVLVSDGANVADPESTGRAQRTFIGTTGVPGEIYIVVSEGRNADGKSAGLTSYEEAELMVNLGCTYSIGLDGGGSSTMYFNGSVLNSARGKERSVVDFVYFK